MMNKINEKDFLVLKINADDHASPTMSLYLPDTGQKIKPFSLANQEYCDLFLQKCETTTRKMLYYQEDNDQTPKIVTQYFGGVQDFSSKFSNIKDYFLISKYFKLANKDHLCCALGINNYTGLVQEWMMFTKINGSFCYCDNNDDKGLCVLYALTASYYFPVSKVNSYPDLKRVINLPRFTMTLTEVFALDLPTDLLCDLDFQSQKDFAKDDGKIFEDMIATKLNAVNVKDWQFCINNKKKLTKLGEFSYPPAPKDEKYLVAVQEVAHQIKGKINKLTTFIKKKVFQAQEIKTQELIINEKLKIFAYADFANEHAVLEMKFVQNSAKINTESKINDYAKRYQYQLYIAAVTRPVYLLVGSYEKFSLFKVEFNQITP